MTSFEVFMWGFAGSASIDVIAALKIYESHAVKFPARYSHFPYYLCRLGLAVIGGGLAVAYGIDKAILAINIGASAPLILTTFSQGMRVGIEAEIPTGQLQAESPLQPKPAVE